MLDSPNRAVVRVDRSPLNAGRWVLTLDCGHEQWVTSMRRPQRKTQLCSKCCDAHRAAPHRESGA
jgi:hypothetical protein